MKDENEYYSQICRFGSPVYNYYGYYGPQENAEYATIYDMYDAMA